MKTNAVEASLSVSPSDAPGVCTFEPPKEKLNGADSAAYRVWEYDVNKIEDPEAFATLLNGLELYPLAERRVSLRDLSQDISNYDPERRNGVERHVKAILYAKGENRGYGGFKSDYDSRFTSNLFYESFYQSKALKQTYGVSLGRSRIEHIWTRCGRVDIPDKYINGDGTISYAFSKFVHSSNPSNTILRYTNKLARVFVESPTKYGFEANWAIFTPPLESKKPQGPTIYGMLTDSNPNGYRPYEHPMFDPKTNDFINTRPFSLDVWYHPKWGSRIDGTRVNEFCIALEKLIKFAGDYIHYRAGAIPSWSFKAFFLDHFG